MSHWLFSKGLQLLLELLCPSHDREYPLKQFISAPTTLITITVPINIHVHIIISLLNFSPSMLTHKTTFSVEFCTLQKLYRNPSSIRFYSSLFRSICSPYARVSNSQSLHWILCFRRCTEITKILLGDNIHIKVHWHFVTNRQFSQTYIVY